MTDSTFARTRAIVVSSIGGGLEMYDFTIYVFFALIISELFFSTSSPYAGLLKTFSVFAIGYIARPLGALFFGHFGDKIGRKCVMLLSISIMALATTGIGLLPVYASIGVMAPIFLVVLRFLQGFAVGGDLPGAITFVAEYAEEGTRGLTCSFVYFAVNIGLLLASLVGAILTITLSHEHLVAFGWRIAFILGILIGIIGYYLRSKIGETPHFDQLAKTKKILHLPVADLFGTHLKQILQGVGLAWIFGVIISQLFLSL